MNNKEHISEHKSTGGELMYQVALFLIWPFLSLMVAIRNFRLPSSRHIVTLFCGFIGLMFIVRPGADAIRYQERFIDYVHNDINDLWLSLIAFFVEQTEKDVYEDVIFYLVSRFTSDPTWLWVTLGLIFGYIYSKNIWFLAKSSEARFNVNAAVFMVAIFFIITPMQGINQFRFWTAAHLFFYGAMHIVLFKKPKYFILTLAAILIHFGMVVPNLALFAFYFLGRRDMIYIPMAIGSALFAEIEFSMFSDYAAYLGPSFEHSFEGYTREEAFDRFEDRQQRSWYVAMWQPMLLYMTYGMMAYTYIKFRDNLSEELKNMTSFLLVLITILNLISHFPMIYRYLPVLFLFVFAYLYLVYKELEIRRLELAVVLCLVPIFLMIVVQTRISIAFISAVILISNPIVALLGSFDISLWEFIR